MIIGISLPLHPAVYLPRVSCGIVIKFRGTYSLALQAGMAVLPAYQSVLKLGRERPNAILLDIGACCESLTNISITWT